MDSSDLVSRLKGCVGCTFVIPAISVSNLGQLAIDLMIETTGATKVDNIWHDAFVPLVGAHPYGDGSNDLCTEFEVYQMSQHKIVFFQFRSPLWENKEGNFLDLLAICLKELKASKVIILSSLYDYERSDMQIKETLIRCCVCPLTQSLYMSTLRHLNCKYMEAKDGVEESGIMSRAMFLPGAGFTKDLHLKCIANELPCVSFFKFCSDGDNIPEAMELATLLDNWLNIVATGQGQDKTFIQPPSWKYMYGGPSPQELFP